MQKFASFRKARINELINTITTTPHFVCAGRSAPFANESHPPAVVDSMSQQYELREGIMFGKRIASDDAIAMCRRVEYDLTGNTIYEAYDDIDPELSSKNYYVITRDRNVYKCLSNNNGARSTSEPTDVDPLDVLKTADGYVWRYLYTVPANIDSKFAIAGYMPVLANSAVQAAATSGILAFDVVQAGSGYATYGTGQVMSTSSNTSATTVRISSDLPAANNFFNGCAFYVTTGTGAGIHESIQRYVSNTSGRFVVLGSASLASAVDPTSSFLIAPNVVVTGAGSGFKGYLDVDPSSNTARGVWVVDPGSGYTFATATIVANTSIGTGAVVRPVLPPIGGHGIDPIVELPTDRVGVSVSFANNQLGTIPTEVTYRSVSLLSNPTHAANSQPYVDSTFDNTLRLNVAVPGGVPFVMHEEVSNADGATGRVAFANTTVTILNQVRGTFANLQVITGQTSGVVATIQALNTPDVNRFSGQLLYAAHATPVSRTPTSTETVRLTFTL